MTTTGARLKLLLVEDSPADVYLVREVLRSEGLELDIEVANDGESAIRILDRVDDSSAAPLNLLLLDLNIPRQNGNCVLERLRQSPMCGTIPVVMMSSSDSPRDRQRAFDLGVTEYFRKPSSLAEFKKLGTLIRRLCPQDVVA